MARPQTYVLVLLSLSTAGLGWLAYDQHLELISLRAAGMGNEERDTWQKKVWALEKTRADKSSEAVATSGQGGEEGSSDTNTERNDRMRGDRRGPQGMEAMMALMNSPEFMKLVGTQQKGAIESRYAALFRNISLTPAEREKLKALLAERQNALVDVLSAASGQGLTGREGREQVRTMMQAAQAEIDNSIKSTLGDQRYEQYKTYEATLPQRSTVDQLSERLSYTQTPLSTQQTEQLISVLASNSGQTGAGFEMGGPGGMGGGRGQMGGMLAGAQAPVPSAQVTTAAIQQAQGILSQPQLEALQQIQSEQQAQQQMARILRNTGGSRQQGGTRGTGTTGTPGAGGPGS